MELKVNGESRTYPGPLTVRELVEVMDLGGRRIAIEVDGEIVPASEHDSCRLQGGEQVEIVGAIGGG